MMILVLAQFVQAQVPPSGFPDGWTISGWDATKAPTSNQANPNNLLPAGQQKIGFGMWNKNSSKTGSVTTNQFSLTGVTNLSIDVAYNEYYISYMKYNVLISTNNGVTWHQVWAATSTGSTNWKWRTILLNLSSFSGNAKLKFVYDGQVEGDLIGFDLGKLLATGLFNTSPPPPPPPVNTAPIITLVGNNPLYLTSANLGYEPGYSATDAEDGNITGKVQITTNLVVPGNGTFYRAYTVKDAGGLTDTKTRILIVSGITDVDDKNLPINYSLANYPNPFNPQTIIRFEIPEGSNVKIDVYNTLGQNVAELMNDYIPTSGIYEIPFNATDLPSGVYFYTLQTQNKFLQQKMLFLK